MTIFTRTWDASYEASPADSNDAREGATRIRHLKADIAERLEVDHSWAGDASDGYHKLVSLLKQGSDPAALTDAIILYSKTVGQSERLFARNDTDAVYELFPAGFLMPFAGSSAPANWYACDGASKDTTTDAALYAAIGYTWGGSGSNFLLPNAAGRVFVGAGTGATSEACTATSANGFTVASNTTKWITGMPVVLSNLTGFTTSATAGPTYYASVVSGTNLRLATTRALAVAGTPDVTASGTGTVTITHTLTARTAGQYLGEDTHAPVAAEVAPHTHVDNYMASTTAYFSGGTFQGYNIGPASTTTTGANTGGSNFNVHQPGFVGLWCIKR